MAVTSGIRPTVQIFSVVVLTSLVMLFIICRVLDTDLEGERRKRSGQFGDVVLAETRTVTTEQSLNHDMDQDKKGRRKDLSDASRAGRSRASKVSGQNETKLILFWSQRPEHDIMRPYDRVKNGTTPFSKCVWSDCRLSRDRSLVREASILVFRPYDPYPDWPEVRLQNQSYVHILSDRPGVQWWLPKFDKKINLTWNFRRDADVPSHVIVVPRRPPVEGRYVPCIPLANKTKSVVWAVSHCNVSSKREQYVAELSKHIDVDIYGPCGWLDCPRNEQKLCSQIWQTKYKFYLAFENSICQDYVTEKLYRTLGLELVPIVLGGADYKTAAPPHSYIDVRDYKSPKHLADYLKHLAKHQDQYLQYFQWKQKYDFSLSVDKMCKLCEIAHNMHSWSRPAHDDYSSWWTNSCNNDLIDQMRKRGRW